MQELHGVTGKPYDTPQVRKKLPTPFSRERIDLDGGTRVKRQWQDVSVLDVAKGDTVAGFGTVAATVQRVQIVQANMPWLVRLYNVMGDYKDYPGEQRVFAFAREKSDGSKP